MFRGRYVQSLLFSSLRFKASVFDLIWWSQTGSNRRPHACKARALPAELWPRTRRRMPFALAPAQRPSFKKACRAEAAEQRRLVGLGRLELPTSRLSSARSNQLSYKPLTTRSIARAHRLTARCIAQAQAPGACSSAKKEKRRRRNPANGAHRSGDRWPLMFLKRSDRTA